ncbi:hypothetical protein F2Q69_00013975 [Brassica cretica]|uniref:Uncharacterized protein n=1 Tax=Brassica cretica TaxID=69181 RepID=A0A8S9QZ66_BRACR|nr:hypothetical protein F2Q69_00013975 [Brassica cretica]
MFEELALALNCKELFPSLAVIESSLIPESEDGVASGLRNLCNSTHGSEPN